MSIEFSQASGARIQSVDFASEARDARAVDLAIYSQWITAVASGDQEAAAAAELADEKFASALESNQRGDNYSLLTVLFAMVLFFTAISERNRSGWAGWFLLALGAVVAAVGGIILATFPVLI
jgi:cytochrome bd-type quinol oxidase subunit 2